jgi:O-acetyl-ADP-ribose deacetylase (regulator of RNase III)
MIPIQYHKGNAVYPDQGSKHLAKLIIHCCNTKCGWGAGFVVGLSGRTKVPEAAFRALPAEQNNLGHVQIMSIGNRTWVANMIAQDGYASSSNPVPFNAEAFRKCLRQICSFVKTTGMEVHGPRMGAGLGQARWEDVERIIEDELCANDVPVFIYDYSPVGVSDEQF